MPGDRDTAFSGAGLTRALLWLSLPQFLGAALDSSAHETILDWSTPCLSHVVQAEQVFLGDQELRGGWVSGLGIDAWREDWLGEGMISLARAHPVSQSPPGYFSSPGMQD